MKFNRIAIIFITLMALLITANESCGQGIIGQLATAIEELNLPTDLAELQQGDPMERPWGVVTEIRKPVDCKLPGEMIILGTLPLTDSKVKQYNLLLYYEEDVTVILCITILYKDGRPTKFYWFGKNKEGKVVDRLEFKECFEAFTGVKIK